MDFDAVRDATPGVYQRHARTWHEERAPLNGERGWLERFTSALPAGGRILDLGCGSGWPIAAHLLEHGFEVVGVDAAPTMIAIARDTLPAGEWHVGDMRDLPELGRFDGVLSWDGWFHLSVAEQRAAMPGLLDMIAKGGAVLLTVGPDEGEVTGTVAGEAVYHASLSPEEYGERLRAGGFKEVAFEAEDKGAGGRSVLMGWGKRHAHPRT